MGSPKTCSLHKIVVLYLALLISSSIPDKGLGNSNPAIIVQVKGKRGDVLARKICNELKALGLNAAPTDLGADQHSEQSAENMARSTNAAAAISVELSSRVVDVWVADRVTGKNVHRKAEILKSDQPEDTIVVVTAVELLRASFMEINRRKKQRGEVVPTKELEDFASSSPIDEKKSREPITNRFHVELGPSISAPSFDMTPSLSIWTGVYVRTARYLDLGVVGLIPIISSSTKIEEGKVKVSPGIIGGMLALPFQVKESRFSFRLGAGGGIALFNMRGVPKDGYVGYEALKYGAVLLGNGAVGFRLTEILVLRLDFQFAWTIKGQVLLAGEREVARIGHPWLYGALLADLAVF